MPFCAGLWGSSAKVSGSWTKMACLKANNVLWLLWREWENNTVLLFLWEKKKNQRQKSVTRCTEITYSTSIMCKKAGRERFWWISWMWWSWKHISIRDWFLKTGRDTENHVECSVVQLPLSTREGCSVFTLFLKHLSVRKSRVICKIFNSRALTQIYGFTFQLLLLQKCIYILPKVVCSLYQIEILFISGL